MDNRTLIESLEYHVNIFEEESKLKNVAVVGGGAVTGGLAGRAIGRGIGKLQGANKIANTVAKNRTADIAKKAVGLSAKSSIKGQILKQAPTIGKGIQKLGKAGALGGAIAGGVLAKKAYDHFKNKKK